MSVVYFLATSVSCHDSFVFYDAGIHVSRDSTFHAPFAKIEYTTRTRLFRASVTCCGLDWCFVRTSTRFARSISRHAYFECTFMYVGVLVRAQFHCAQQQLHTLGDSAWVVVCCGLLRLCIRPDLQYDSLF